MKVSPCVCARNYARNVHEMRWFSGSDGMEMPLFLEKQTVFDLKFLTGDCWEALQLIEVAALSQPRLLEAVRRLKPAQLENIRTAAELHWLVLNDTFDVANRGHDDNRKELDWLLGLIAYTMHRHEHYVGCLLYTSPSPRDRG